MTKNPTACFLMAMGAVLAIQGRLHADPEERALQSRVSELIQQLGHEEFARREAAGDALAEIGEPALPGLRSAAATDVDPEVRWRAKQVIEAVSVRLRAVAAEKELARWQGEWTADDGQWIAIHEDQWLSGATNFGPVEGTLQVVEIRERMALVDLIIHGGPTKGSICRLILRREGDLLHYCGTYEPAHPTEFKSENNTLYITLKRAPQGSIPQARKKPIPMPPR